MDSSMISIHITNYRRHPMTIRPHVFLRKVYPTFRRTMRSEMVSEVRKFDLPMSLHATNLPRTTIWFSFNSGGCQILSKWPYK
ncbi:hypothetical protein BD410DRAFT_276721 [Rickenella mellea]|uniref:Uncharacterized protein n=1 Tax=Rickenella mellea TaxID=50990 RepID=A0A4Y7Q540_9AGAM|nr:hypothetical protein BD410DRAFT_276721 [Rickenella mellea]